MKIFVEILFNLGTITMFGIVSSLMGSGNKNSVRRQLFHGIIFGFGAVIGMLNPVIIKPGLIFDGRSVRSNLWAPFRSDISFDGTYPTYPPGWGWR